MADTNIGAANNGDGDYAPVKAPQPVEDDVWAFASKKPKKKKEACNWDFDQPAAEPSGSGDFDYGWGNFTTKTENTASIKETKDEDPGRQESKPDIPAVDDWSSWLCKKKEKKTKKTTMPELEDQVKAIGSEVPQNANGATNAAEMPVNSSFHGRDAWEPGHGAVGSCLCERCVDEARQKVEVQLKEPNWTSNYIGKLQAQISLLENRNEMLSKKSRRSRRYSYSSISDASCSDDDERTPVTFHPGPMVVGPPKPAEAAQEEAELKIR